MAERPESGAGGESATGSPVGTPGAPAGSAWSPLAHPVFRALWLASVASNLGTWIHGVAAVWLMTSLTPSPAMAALVQTASSLPLVLLALPAGAVADMVDRRRLLLGSQAWMLVVAATLAVIAFAGATRPWLLLVLTFALGAGSAFTAPAWQATTLELVPRGELPAAIALGSASLNGTRALGPVLGGLLVSALGAGAAFLLNAASFLAVIAVLAGWRRKHVESALPREQVFGAIRGGLRYVRHSPAMRAILARIALHVAAASALWALLPVLARREMGLDAGGYGLLLSGFGAGALIGAATLHRARGTIGGDRLIDACGLGLAGALAALATVPSFAGGAGALVVAGYAWMVPLTILNLATQAAVPSWVRARALAVLLLVLQGGVALGAAAWGGVAERAGTPAALGLAAVGVLVATLAGLRVRLPDTGRADFSPLGRPVPDALATAAEHDEGPVLVTVEYRIDPGRSGEFLVTMEVVGRMRRRGGAWRWGLFEDTERPGAWLESFLVESWLDHLRQHERMTVVDRDISRRASAFHLGPEPPAIRHFVAGRTIG